MEQAGASVESALAADRPANTLPALFSDLGREVCSAYRTSPSACGVSSAKAAVEDESEAEQLGLPVQHQFRLHLHGRGHAASIVSSNCLAAKPPR